MHQTITSRKAIYIPHSIDVIPLDELASRLAATIHDPSGTDAEWSRHNDLTRVLKADFVRAGGAGQLVVRHPVAHVPVQPDTKGAVVLVDDAACYLAESGSRFRITRHIQALPFVGLHPLQPVPLADVPHMVARAMYPESDDEVMEVHGYGVTNFEVQSRIERAQMLGELTLINPTDGQPLPFSSPHACVAAGDLCDFFSGGAEKQPPAMDPAVPLPAPVTWQGHTYQPGPEITPEEADEAAAWADAVNAAGELERKERREKLQQTWWGVTGPYIVSVMHEHQCTTAKNLFYKLEELAGESSPFKRGKEANRGALVVKELAQTVSLKTFQNRWKEIKKAALG